MRILAIVLLHPSHGILRSEETHHHVAGVSRRRVELTAEFKPLAGTEDAARRQRSPGVDFLSGGVARCKTQARHLHRLAGGAYDVAFDDQNADAVLSFLRNPDILKCKTAQIDRQSDPGK